jgi:tRNA(fMet)-specific endonuclease VapC
MGLLIDSGIIIRLEREEAALIRLETLARGEPSALAAISVSELLVGAERADTQVRRERRMVFIEGVLGAIPVIPFDTTIARVHARLFADLLKRGQPVGANDLLIAATAVALGYGVLTINVRDFARVPGLRVVQAGQ